MGNLNEKQVVCRLNKPIYGLKQSPRCWHKTLHGVLVGEGCELTRSKADNCVYTWRQGDKLLVLMVFVDDILLAHNDVHMRDKIKRKLMEAFDMREWQHVSLPTFHISPFTNHILDVQTSRLARPQRARP